MSTDTKLDTSIRDLGGKLYHERSELAANPVIEGSDAAKKIERLDLAARWNALAMSGNSPKAERRS